MTCTSKLLPAPSGVTQESRPLLTLEASMLMHSESPMVTCYTSAATVPRLVPMMVTRYPPAYRAR